MRRLLTITAVVIFSFVGGIAFAQSTAMPVVFGFLTTNGCLGSLSTCWQPVSSTNTFPVTSN